MNRNSAKLLTTAGIFCSLAAIVLLISNLAEATNVPIFLLPALFVSGIVLVVLSLAYYTEK